MSFIPNHITSDVGATPTVVNVSSIIQELDDDPLSKTARRFNRSTVVPFRETSRSQKYRKAMVVGECPQGQNYYSCQANGFTGCCSKNPCNPVVVCSESNDSTTATLESTSAALSQSTTELATGTSSASAVTTATTANSKSETREVSSAVTSATETFAEATRNTTAPQVGAEVISAPSCPKGNGTTFSDNNNIAYIVHCASDNTAESYNSVQVSIGGYAQCFSSCSTSRDCAGFTYVGLDGGVCYLKATMPNDTYVAKDMNNYISCAKLDPNASASQPTPTPTQSPSYFPSPSKNPNKGAVAGGIVGGLATIALVLILIAFLARRRRKSLESKRATLTHVFGGPIEPGHCNRNAQATLPLHNRTGSTSTSSDPFVQFGGYKRNTNSNDNGNGNGNDSIARDYATATTSPSSNKGSHSFATTDPSYPVDIMSQHFPNVKTPSSTGAALYLLPSATYQTPPSHHPTGDVHMLDNTPVIAPSAPRSPRFREHIYEMEDTSSQAPGLDDVRRRQLERWVGGDGRKQEDVSPDLSDSPLDLKFVVSPMRTLDSRKGGK